MKKYCLFILIAAGLGSCEKHFLQIPSTTGTTTIETVFSTTVNANQAIAAAYSNCLIAGLPYSGLDHGTIAALSGEFSWGYNWHMTYKIINTGLNANGQSDDDFDGNYSYIRQAYLIYENIDNVKDMDAATKTNVKGEMLALVAYQFARTQHRVTQTQRLFLPDIGDVDQIRNLPDDLKKIFFPPRFKQVLQFETDVEMVLNRGLAAARDNNYVPDSGMERFFDSVLNDRFVD